MRWLSNASKVWSSIAISLPLSLFDLHTTNIDQLPVEDTIDDAAAAPPYIDGILSNGHYYTLISHLQTTSLSCRALLQWI